MKMLMLIMLLFIFLACTEEENVKEKTFVNLTNDNDSVEKDKNISKVEEIVSSEHLSSPSKVISEVEDTIAPIEPIISSYSNLVDKELQLIVQGEIGANVYIESVFEGVISSDQELKVMLSNPHENYFENFEIVLSDEAGNDSIPLLFNTTFYRHKLDENYTYYIPQGVKVIAKTFSQDFLLTAYPRYAHDVITLMMPFNNEWIDALKAKEKDTITSKLNHIVNAITNTKGIKKLTSLSEHQSRQTVVTEYTVELEKAMSSSKLSESLFSNIMEESIYGFYFREKVKEYKNFSIKVMLYQKYKSATYLSISIVPTFLSLFHKNMLNTMLNSQNIKRNNMAVYMDEEIFKVKEMKEEKDFANFLFVIDDSGSMGSYQRAIALASKKFISAINEVGIDFKIAIITTGELDEAFEPLETNGVIENNLELFEDTLHVGVSGSGTETAIYNMELALASKEYGDKKDGILTRLNMPKMNENLSIVILTDEVSSYVARAGKEFDLENNIFVDRGYKVYLIGSPKDIDTYYPYGKKPLFQHKEDDYGLYGALVKKTGGILADIRNIHAYDTLMDTIVQNVLGDFGYKLRQSNVIESTIYVTLNGEEVMHNDKNGWKYMESSNSILFLGTSVPDEDDEVIVKYAYVLDE